MDLASFIWEIKKFGLENFFKKYYSIYPAQVVNNKDPENRWRLKLKVPDILDDKELSEWAEPSLPTAGLDKNANSSTTAGKYGSFFPPKVGDHVWVEFRMGDLKAPIYRNGGWWAKNEVPAFLSDDRKNAVFISRYGHKITVDETDQKAIINIETNKKYKVTLDETTDKEKITIQCGVSQNILQLSDEKGKEYILLQDKNGDISKWDITNKKWTINFEGDQEEVINGYIKKTVQKQVEQIFNDLWKVTIAKSTTIQSGQSAVVKQPIIAIGDGTVELLATIYKMMEELGKLRVWTNTGPAAPMTVATEWPNVKAEMDKIKSITGNF
jgi:hypothetical protein